MTLTDSYRIEYETTALSIDDICHKYSITTDQLPGHEDWIKRTTTPIAQPTQNTSNEDIVSDIATVKEVLLSKIKDSIDNPYLEVKELKDITKMVIDLEGSYKDKNHGPTVNILVQNLTERYKDDI